ncbi:MAG TPA: hypothetical protein VJ756_07700 [Terriglobales bacterium]|nr:hypothetical protein [Terriglobales bacterium]
MKPEDEFLNGLKVPIERDSEPEWSVADVWADATPGIVLIRRSVASTRTSIAVKSATDASDLYAVPPIGDPKKLTLDGLRKMVGEWLLEGDRFLTKEKAPVALEQEGKWSVADVATDNAVLIRRDAQTVEIKLKRGDAEIGSALRLAPGAKLADVRRRLEAGGDMAADDAFVDADGREQIPIGEEATRSLQSALKDRTLRIISRADWG